MLDLPMELCATSPALQIWWKLTIGA